MKVLDAYTSPLSGSRVFELHTLQALRALVVLREDVSPLEGLNRLLTLSDHFSVQSAEGNSHLCLVTEVLHESIGDLQEET